MSLLGHEPSDGADEAYDITHGPCDACEGDVSCAEGCATCGRGVDDANARMVDDDLAADDVGDDSEDARSAA